MTKWLAALVVAGCGTAAAQQALPPMPTGNGALALTFWDCSTPAPQSFYLPDIMRSPVFLEVRAHEDFHVRQMRRVGCDAWHKASRDARFRVAAEAQAFCAMVHYNVATYGVPLDMALDRAGVWFKDYAGLSFADARALVAFFVGRGPDCGLPPEGTP